MATSFWVGAQIANAQVDTLTVTAVANGGTITATIGIAPLTAAISYVMSATDTTSTAASALQALLSASVDGRFAEITWTVSGAVITGTGPATGQPFTLAASAAGGAAMTRATAAPTSPNDANDAKNWTRSGAASLPQNTDDVVLQNSAVPILWNVDQLSAVTFNSLTRWQSFTAQVGLPDLNPNGYVEYRPRYFKFGVNASPITVLLGANDVGSGPTLERYDPGGNQIAWVVQGAGSASQAYNVYLLGTNAANTFKGTGTIVALAINPGETGKLTGPSMDGGGTLDWGAGATIAGTATFINSSGTINTLPATALAVYGGSQVTVLTTGGTLTTLNASDGSNVTWNSNSTITTMNLLKGSTFDKSGDLRATTITAAVIDANCQIKDPNSVLTITNGTTVNGQVQSGWFQTGTGRVWTVV